MDNTFRFEKVLSKYISLPSDARNVFSLFSMKYMGSCPLNWKTYLCRPFPYFKGVQVWDSRIFMIFTPLSFNRGGGGGGGHDFGVKIFVYFWLRGSFRAAEGVTRLYRDDTHLRRGRLVYGGGEHFFWRWNKTVESCPLIYNFNSR